MINHSKLTNIINTIQTKKVLVLGDIMLDQYILGSVERISPEAPIPIINVNKTKYSAGGAGNVLKNLNSLNIKASFISIIGNDTAGKTLKKYIEKFKNVEYALLIDKTRKTTCKTRYMSDGQQLFRADDETINILDKTLKEKIFKYFLLFIKQTDIIIFSDYGKGIFLDNIFCQKLIKEAFKNNKKIIVDPKGNSFEKYKGVFFITPNSKEAFNVTKINPSNNNLAEKCGRLIINNKWSENVLLTRGPNGLSIIQNNRTDHIKSNTEEVFDVTGAGDTVISLFTAAVAAGNSFTDSAHFANIGASIVVKKLGTVSLTSEELFKSIASEKPYKILNKDTITNTVKQWKSNKLKIGFTNGCFDLIHSGHIDMFLKAAECCDRLIIGINSDKSIKRLKGNQRPILNFEARQKIISSLDMVDAVIFFEEDTPITLIKHIKPNVLFKGADYKLDEIVGAKYIKSIGGKTIRIKLTKNQSTTRLVKMLNDLH
ncbi:D-glycero-beta-D-manno-heptose 1-phosphate adenylyltransferase [Alphaproteobacteria bacterium]|nr:D-glycero-beta-D-manno-heptose 1-phosphate adenylyltransferase [Alphaproteobacteria bacterium]